MADWRDGAECAPQHRPFGFAMPRAAPLERAVRRPGLADGQPLEAPAHFAAPQAPSLQTLAPRTTTSRDPRQAFGTDPASSGWQHGPTPEWTPTQPLLLSSDSGWSHPSSSGPEAFAAAMPAPVGVMTAQAPFAPPTGAPVVASAPALPTAPVGPWTPPIHSTQAPVPAIYSQPHPQNPYAPPGAGSSPAASPARPVTPLAPWIAWLCLLGGAIIHPLSFLLLAGALVAALRIRPRLRGVVTTLGVATAMAGLVGFVSALTAEQGEAWSSFNAMARIVCWMLMLVGGWMLRAVRRR